MKLMIVAIIVSFIVTLLLGIVGITLDNNRLLIELRDNQQTKTYQITTEQIDSDGTITSVYLKSANSREKLNRYLERFTADELVTSVIEIDTNELYTVSIKNNTPEVMFQVVTRKVMKDGIERQSTYLMTAQYEDEIAEHFQNLNHTILSIEAIESMYLIRQIEVE